MSTASEWLKTHKAVIEDVKAAQAKERASTAAQPKFTLTRYDTEVAVAAVNLYGAEEGTLALSLKDITLYDPDILRLADFIYANFQPVPPPPFRHDQPCPTCEGTKTVVSASLASRLMMTKIADTAEALSAFQAGVRPCPTCQEGS